MVVLAQRGILMKTTLALSAPWPLTQCVAAAQRGAVSEERVAQSGHVDMGKVRTQYQS